MAWQKRKVLLTNITEDEDGKKVYHRYVVNKSKGAGKKGIKTDAQKKKLKLKKYHPILKKHVEFTETKYK